MPATRLIQSRGAASGSKIAGELKGFPGLRREKGVKKSDAFTPPPAPPTWAGSYLRHIVAGRRPAPRPATLPTSGPGESSIGLPEHYPAPAATVVPFCQSSPTTSKDRGRLWRFVRRGTSRIPRRPIQAHVSIPKLLILLAPEKLATEYIERHAKRKKSSWREDERRLRGELLPEWGQPEPGRSGGEPRARAPGS